MEKFKDFCTEILNEAVLRLLQGMHSTNGDKQIQLDGLPLVSMGSDGYVQLNKENLNQLFIKKSGFTPEGDNTEADFTQVEQRWMGVPWNGTYLNPFGDLDIFYDEEMKPNFKIINKKLKKMGYTAITLPKEVKKPKIKEVTFAASTQAFIDNAKQYIKACKKSYSADLEVYNTSQKVIVSFRYTDRRTSPAQMFKKYGSKIKDFDKRFDKIRGVEVNTSKSKYDYSGYEDNEYSEYENSIGTEAILKTKKAEQLIAAIMAY